ncbi:MAG: helix-turn-helix transcriptional regulator [Butyricicoccaceae bacterium]
MRYNYVGMKLKSLREEAGYTPEQLSRFVDCEPEIITDWEDGNAEPNLSQMVILSKLYSEPLENLFTGLKAEELVSEDVVQEYRHESWLNELSRKSGRW